MQNKYEPPFDYSNPNWRDCDKCHDIIFDEDDVIYDEGDVIYDKDIAAKIVQLLNA